MNRYTFKSIFIIICSMLMINGNSYACDQYPIADIDMDPEAATSYRWIYENSYPIEFEGISSHDMDEGGEYITQYSWYLYSYAVGGDEDERLYFNYPPNSNFNFYPNAYVNYNFTVFDYIPGRYEIGLYVLDNEGWQSDYPYYYDHRDVFLIDCYANCTDYIAQGTGMGLGYQIAPDTDWSYDSAWVYIVDSSYNFVYAAEIHELIDLDILEPENEFSGTVPWDGKGNWSMLYYGNYVPAGNYQLWMYMELPDGATIDKYQDSFTVVKADIGIDVDGDADIDADDETGEENPGKYINVNWDDDDGDGWTNANPPTPNGSYTGDKVDSEITNGDDDLRPFTVSISPSEYLIANYPSSTIILTYPENKIKIWRTNTKKNSMGESSFEQSGGQGRIISAFPMQYYLEGVAGSSSFRDVELKATWSENNNVKDTVKITNFEVDLVGLFGPANGVTAQQTDNDKHLNAPAFLASDDTVGKISWDDKNGNGTPEGINDIDAYCWSFRNCMECQGTVKPSGVTTQVQFDYKRLIWSKAWEKKGSGSWNPIQDRTPWDQDDLVETDEDKTPSNNDHIYQIDGPGVIDQNRGPTRDYVAYYANLKEWVMVEIDGTWYQCSNYYKWHSQVYVKPKDLVQLTRDSTSLQKLGYGWIDIPSNP